MPGFSIRNPYFILVCTLILCLIGGTVLTRMPVDMFPRLDLTAVVTATLYPGMPPEQVEKNITERQERFFTLAAGIEHIESRSMAGAGIIKIFFQPGTNPDAAVSTVANLALAEMRRMPPGTLPPYVLRFDASSLPVCLIALRGDGLTEAALRDVGHYRVRTQVAKVPGAAVPPPFGGRYRQIMLYADPQKLESYQLSPMDVVRAVNEANVILPSGNIRIGPLDYPIFTNSQLTDLETVGRVPIKTVGSAQVTVSDVATVRDGAQIQYNTVRVDGQPSVYQPVLRQGGDANTLSIVNAVRREVDHLLDVPDSLVARVVFDQSSFIRNAIQTLVHEGAVGLFLTSLMVLLFLGSFRGTLAVFFSIPLSALAAFICLYATGGSINSMTLGGLALAFSRLIDDSVVVLENIFRHLDMGKQPEEAAREGANEVALPVLASTLTTAVVFFPVVFLQGVSKDLFTALSITVVLALAASYLVAMTIVPLFCARYLKAHPGDAHHHPAERVPRWVFWFNRGFVRLMTAYDVALAALLRRPLNTVLTLLALFAASLLLYPQLGTTLFPRTDPAQFVMNIKAPLGTSLEETERLIERVEQIARRVVLPADYDITVSNAGVVPDFSAIYTSNSGPHNGFVQVSLKENHQIGSYEYMSRMRRAVREELPELTTYFQSGGFVDSVLNFGMPAPINVQVSGPDLPSIFATATGLAPRLRALPGVSDVFIPQDLDLPAIRVDVDRRRAALLGLSQREIATNLITSVASNAMVAPTFWTDPKSGNDYFLTVQYAEKSIRSVADLNDIPLRGVGSRGVTNLQAVAEISRVSAPTEVAHFGLRKVVDVFVNLEHEDLGRAGRQIEQLVANTKLPPGVRIDLRGSLEGMRSSFRSFAWGLILAVALLYLILVAQFRSFLDPLLILLAVPMGLAGTLLLLWVTGTTINVQSLMGVIMMVGIVVSNSILLVEFMRRLRQEGMPLEDAVPMAGRVRLRPILMTSLATIIGLVPMALKLGTGSEAYAPLARAIIGGMTVSLIFTVFIVPAAYQVAYRRTA
ncbi:MAG: efflux RND transporter permease subunit [Acidobacteria bacterium]|nr:efflux RND transporter permease subunit [Acidobacteriota bacterium]